MELERRFREITADDADAMLVEDRADGPPKIRGLAAAYGKWSLELGGPDGFREIIEPGAFDKVLSRRKLDVVALFDHEGQPLARTIGGSLRLAATDRGLEYDFDIPDTQLGRDVASLIRAKILFGSSFAFTVDPKGERWGRDDKGNQTRTISEFSGLFDVSVVTHAAYGSATSVAVRSMAREAREARERAAVAIRAAAASAALRLRSLG